MTLRFVIHEAGHLHICVCIYIYIYIYIYIDITKLALRAPDCRFRGDRLAF